ncbi:hypothetical protein HKX48_009167 [Thoreauomyces humboldtii]|nr:hypothetical protein HKX48_009167 [Thoreauomyces humboldtii]
MSLPTSSSITTALENYQTTALRAPTFLPIVPPVWPLPCPPPHRILILASSFNPPTTAHLTLLRKATRPSHTARLLLLSTSNPDKRKPSGASHVQRIEMMAACLDDGKGTDGVGVISVGRFFDMASVLVDHLEQRKEDRGSTRLELDWCVGFDTLVRIFDVKYYDDQGHLEREAERFFQRCSIVCADRLLGDGQRVGVREWLDGGGVVGRWKDKVEVVEGWGDNGEGEVSSTRARTILARGDDADQEELETIVPPKVIECIRRLGLYSA